MNHYYYPFDFSVADKRGWKPSDNAHLIGARYRHTANGFVYTITQFIWMGELDSWGLVHICEGAPNILFTRSVENFFGVRANGAIRFDNTFQLPDESE